MKNFIFLFLFFFVFVGISAQTHRFIYEFHFKKDSLSKDFQKNNMTLDINPDEVKFYEYDYAVTDSLNKIRDTKSCGWDDTPALKRKRNSNDNTNYTLLTDLYEYKTKDVINWNISKETKQKGGYLLQKATAKFGGRNWTAWFCIDIPINEGPYKFRGLPGLIFEIEDDKHQFNFTLAKSYKLNKTYDTSGFLESFCNQKALIISEKMLTKKQLELYNDPLHDFKEQYQKSKANNEEGQWKVMNVEIKDISQFKELTERYQVMMCKENNPIELDKAIHYPEK